MGKDTWFNKYDLVGIAAVAVGTIASIAGIYCNYKGNQTRVNLLNSQVDPRITTPPSNPNP